MMKKKKFLATILIASSAFLGTGYSWWTDGLQVGGVVSTGEFSVVPVEAKLSQCTVTKAGNEVVNIMDETHPSGCDDFSYNMPDLIPGRIYLIDAEFNNRGSIPAVVDCIEITPKISKDYDKIKAHIAVKGVVEIVEGSKKLEGSKSLPIDTTMVDLKEKLMQLKDWKLEPGQSLVFRNFQISLVKNVGKANKEINKQERMKQKENEFAGINVGFQLELSFKQHNQQQDIQD